MSGTYHFDIIKPELPLYRQFPNNALQTLVPLKGLSDHG